MSKSNSVYIYKTIFSIAIILLLFNCNDNQKLPDPLEAGWNNKVVCEVLEDNDKVRTLKCTFPPSVGHERHYHKAHFGYTLAGSTFRIKDTTGTREVTIPTGYNFYNEKVDWHEVLNIGDSTAIFLIVEPK
ncbi:cupin domain-containing protein [Psychroserpens sp.]